MNTHNLQGGGALARRAARPPRVERVPVLGILYHDPDQRPAVELRADPSLVDLQVVEAIAVEPPEEALREEFVWCQVSRRHKHLWLSKCCLGVYPIVPRSAEAEQLRRWECEAVRELRELRAELLRARKERVPA